MASAALTGASRAARDARDERVDEDDVQALVLQGYGKLRAAAFLVLELGGTAQAWLTSLVGQVTAGGGRPDGTALNVAFTASGLAELGLPPGVIAGFSIEFQEGMTSPHRRRLLGDEGAAAPENWAWGGGGAASDGPPVDALLMLYASDEARLAALVAEQRKAATAAGVRVLITLDTHDIGFGEHFGFRDGLSQPALLGTGRPVGDTPERDRLAPGEFLLGYLNEHGQHQRTPLVDPAADPDRLLAEDASGSGRRDFGRNGSYTVVRTLSQDVSAFWGFMDGATRGADDTSDQAAMTALAAHMVGRWPSGAALTLAPDKDLPELAEVNDFAYHAEDGHGLGCPIGAHVRRANPRDSLPPKPGEAGSIAVNKRHRLLRRGRPYGAPIDVDTALAQAGTAGSAVAGEDRRGLHFIALCADIARQFEFITHTWALNPHFAGLCDDADPILGGHQPNGKTFTTQATPVRHRVHDVPPFVTVRGGAYFFMPGMRALRYLATPHRR